MSQCLVIKIGSHVVGNANDEGAKVLEMAIERRRLLEELEFDHVTVVAVRRMRVGEVGTILE